MFITSLFVAIESQTSYNASASDCPLVAINPLPTTLSSVLWHSVGTIKSPPAYTVGESGAPVQVQPSSLLFLVLTVTVFFFIVLCFFNILCVSEFIMNGLRVERNCSSGTNKVSESESLQYFSWFSFRNSWILFCFHVFLKLSCCVLESVWCLLLFVVFHSWCFFLHDWVCKAGEEEVTDTSSDTLLALAAC